MEDARKQLVDRLIAANNILVTVSRDPSVDQLAAMLGLTLLLNKQGKHAAAVFSGEVPSTLEFLKPDETFEKNTDSLRDFIIALDKNKADKLRYKVEDNVVRIFITPYKTSITQDDLEFSQGDFNIDLVVALGVSKQEDIDEAIIAHGRILHDATVATVNTSAEVSLGTINWQQPTTSSLSEMVTSLVQDMNGASLDEQIATALMTGIVAETQRFSNQKTSAQTMSVSAILLGAGANQQLVASKLDGAVSVDHETSDNRPSDQDAVEAKKEENSDKAALAIDHDNPDAHAKKPADKKPAKKAESVPDKESKPPTLAELEEDQKEEKGPKLVTEPPTLGGTLTANSTQPTTLEPTSDPLSMPAAETPQLLTRETPQNVVPDQTPALTPPPVPTTDLQVSEDGEIIPPAAPAPASSAAPDTELDDARDEVSRALNAVADQAPPQPIAALNAQPIDLNPPADTASVNQVPTTSGQAVTPPLPANPLAPPPVPPPIPFQFGNPQQK